MAEGRGEQNAVLGVEKGEGEKNCVYCYKKDKESGSGVV